MTETVCIIALIAIAAIASLGFVGESIADTFHYVGKKFTTAPHIIGPGGGQLNGTSYH